MAGLHGETIAAGAGETMLTASFGGGAPHRFGVASDRARAFAKARRRSARIRLARKAILIGGIGGCAAIVGIALFDPFGTKFGALSFNALSLDGTKIVMEKPKLAGFRNDGQPYLLTAERALQDVKQPTIVELEKVDGDIGGAAGGESTRLSADAGVYDTVRERMELSKNVHIRNGRFDVSLRSAKLDFKSGAYGSDEPVEVHVDGGTTIFSDKASARNNGQELSFEGHVRTNIIPQSDASSGAAGQGFHP
jgi:lipopolysaccharide export system protein LptC